MTRTFTTFQDFEKRESQLDAFILESIKLHQSDPRVIVANSADLYDAQQNETINNYVQTIFTLTGQSVQNFTASNRKIASNFFNLLNTQRCAYSLGKGVSFANADKNGDKTKETLGGTEFDLTIYDAAYDALKHGVSFVMVDEEGFYVFPLTQFVPMFDEESGALRAGIRYWRLSHDRPLQAVLYEEDGYTVFRGKADSDSTLEQLDEKRAYKTTYAVTPAIDNPRIIGEENYSGLPIVPMWASRLKQSTLIGLRESIDAYDLIKSGFANDLSDCAEIYWMVENYGGMSDKELAKFLDRLRMQHIVNVDTSQGGKVTPYTQEIPYQARQALLEDLRNGMFRDFCALDTAQISAGAKTATEIQSAYQPVDNKASDFENNVSKCIKQILALKGIEDSPVFTRDKVANQLEIVNMVNSQAQYLDEETILRKYPNITSDEVDEILKRNEIEAEERMVREPVEEEEEEEPEE